MQRCRSLLFVPGDSERKIEKSKTNDADVVIYDLEDAVVPERRVHARELVRDIVASDNLPFTTCVRVNPIDSEAARDDLAAVMAAAPAFIMQPKIRTADDIDALAAAIEAQERNHGLVVGSTKIIALVTETPEMTLALPTMTSVNPRVTAMTWGGEDLSAALGAVTNRDESGHWTFTYQLARSQCLLAARACGVLAIDTLFSDFRDSDGLAGYARVALRDGFDGMLAIHPAQTGVINTAFTPSDADLAHARRVVEAFAASPEAGAVQLDGRMLDRPHLTQAKKILDRAG